MFTASFTALMAILASTPLSILVSACFWTIIFFSALIWITVASKKKKAVATAVRN
jgi:hypothetical protein